MKLEPLGFHEARHTLVSLMHAAGNSLEEIGDFVGHSSTYMVDRYRHLIEGQRERPLSGWIRSSLARKLARKAGSKAAKRTVERRLSGGSRPSKLVTRVRFPSPALALSSRNPPKSEFRRPWRRSTNGPKS
jgi:hypothetical protein